MSQSIDLQTFLQLLKESMENNFLKMDNKITNTKQSMEDKIE